MDRSSFPWQKKKVYIRHGTSICKGVKRLKDFMTLGSRCEQVSLQVGLKGHLSTRAGEVAQWVRAFVAPLGGPGFSTEHFHGISQP